MKYHNKKRTYPYKRQMKRKLRRIAYIAIAAVIAGGLNYYKKHDANNPEIASNQAPGIETGTRSLQNQKQIVEKIRAAASDSNSRFWVALQGTVIKLLKDDLKGSQHQKFLIRIAPDITLLVSHNIDLAPRVPLKKGDQISLRGRYEWNHRGGLVHWTHHDPRGKKQGGWIRVNGKDYR